MKKIISQFRLPQTVIPLHYDLFLNPSIKSKEFEGKVFIQIYLNETTRQININSDELEINEILLKSISNSKGIKPISSSPSKSINKEILEIKFQDNLNPGKYCLEISFEGEMSNEDFGFYYSKDPRLSLGQNLIQNQEDESLHTVLSTIFQPTGARSAFPCFDEPNFKATFKLTLQVNDKRFIAISNTEVEEIIQEKSFLLYKFKQTPKMSTYLISWYIGQFEYLEGYSKSKVRIRFYFPVGRKNDALTSFGMAIKALDYYEDIFNIP